MAQFNLGLIYTRGLHKDEIKAFKWFTKAARKGHAEAQFRLGLMYINGREIGKNDTEACKWFTRAALQGNADSQYLLGVIYAKGQYGVAKSDIQARTWYTKAAEQWHVYAQFNLGVMYANGQGGEKNYTEARICFARANGGGHPEAIRVAIEYLSKAAEQGNAEAQENLTMLQIAQRVKAHNQSVQLQFNAQHQSTQFQFNSEY